MTPLGTPVLPLEKTIVASDSESPSFAKSRDSAEAGRTNAMANMRAFARDVNPAITSSRKTMPSIGAISARAMNFRDVRMVVIPQRSTAPAIDSRPAVKFRFTDVLPASAVATFASAPPTDAGSRMPMRGSSAV